MGKTTWMLQVARNIARQGRPVLYFCYEHDQTTMLIRLVALEAGLIGGVDAPGINRIRATFEAADGLGRSLSERLADTSGGAEALEIVKEYSDRLTIHRSSGSTDHARPDQGDRRRRSRRGTARRRSSASTTCRRSRCPASTRRSGPPPSSPQVKDMTLDYDVPALCIVASDKEGISTGKRMRVNHMRGSSALAYEADTVLMLNNKYDVVARHHLVYDTGNVERFRHWAVLSIEKNRSGLTGVDMEFPKRFEQSRFETQGQLVREKLVDERVFTE